MNLLITGSEGRIGRHLAGLLHSEGYSLRGFDTAAPTDLGAQQGEQSITSGGGSTIRRLAARLLPQRGLDQQAIDAIAEIDPIGARQTGDLRDLTAVRKAMQGMDGVIHLGAIPSDRDDGSAVMQTNAMGTWNVLQAALECGVQRVVFFSSINAQGSVKSIWPTEYLPIDDDYPHHPMTPYQLSKHLGEEICRSYSERHGMITLCLRPTWVAHESHYAHAGFGTDTIIEPWRSDYWAYVDIRDVCDAVLRCLQVEHLLHDCFLLAADDTSAHITTAELLARYYPSVRWSKIEQAAYLAENPFRSLVDCSHAKTLLGWQPKHSWRDSAARQP